MTTFGVTMHPLRFKEAFALQLHIVFQAALQVGFLKHLGDIATVLQNLVCLSLFCFFMSFETDWMMMRSDLCGSLCKQKMNWIITINGKINVNGNGYFLLTHYS